jgi:mono/diheme cytochrome c family protein
MAMDRSRFSARTLIALSILAVAAASCSKGPEESQTAPAASADTVATAEHGAYLATIMGCHDCHTPGTFYEKPDFQRALSGSELGWSGPWGTSYARNLTPDMETGIGAWSEDDIIRTLQTGIRPDGSHLLPPMPWPLYAHLTPKDVRSIAKYLKGLAPVSHRAPAVVPPGQKPNTPAFILPLPPPEWDVPKAPAQS